MLIDLMKFADELDAFGPALDPFLEPLSHRRFLELVEQLKASRDNPRIPAFSWSTPAWLTTISADGYNGGRRPAQSAQVQVGIDARFSRLPDARRIWNIERLITQVSIARVDQQRPSLSFHIDMKNPNQLGPGVHMQVSDTFLHTAVGHRLSVPRFPITLVLPTDCIDFVLTEFFPNRWNEHLSGMWRIGLLRRHQEKRLRDLVMELWGQWQGSPNSTLIGMIQNSSLDGLRLV